MRADYGTFQETIGASHDMLNALKGWWENSSSTWQEGVFYTLCAAYSLVGAVAVIQLIRIEFRVPEYGWTTQKVFHLMNFIVNAARALVFGFYKSVFSFQIQILRVILLELPGLLFFSTYTLLVLFWAEIYYQARSVPTSRLRPGFLLINGFVYFIQIVIWLLEWLNYNAIIQIVARLFLADLCFEQQSLSGLCFSAKVVPSDLHFSHPSARAVPSDLRFQQYE
ncbi:hypothetical protein L7F22_048443 [Adiantum nelumboides]|nr:hypothetical protein [Adiantum nelumboides]